MKKFGAITIIKSCVKCGKVKVACDWCLDCWDCGRIIQFAECFQWKIVNFGFSMKSLATLQVLPIQVEKFRVARLKAFTDSEL
jgi:hypothetical protein